MLILISAFSSAHAQTGMGGFEMRTPLRTDNALIFYLGLAGGSDWADLSRNSLSFINTDVVSASDQSLDFNGTSAYLEFAHQALLSPEQFTFAFWINPDTWANNTTVSILSKKTGNNGYLFYYTGGELVIAAGNPGNLWNTGISIPTGTWSHIAYTYDAHNTDKFLYFNGAPAASGTKGATPTSTEPLRIGRNSGNTSPQYFSGKMADIAFLARCLSSQEVARVYLTGRNPRF
jgi:hypothetical protein